jgi:hypothetical protein
MRALRSALPMRSFASPRAAAMFGIIRCPSVSSSSGVASVCADVGSARRSSFAFWSAIVGTPARTDGGTSAPIGHCR